MMQRMAAEAVELVVIGLFLISVWWSSEAIAALTVAGG